MMASVDCSLIVGLIVIIIALGLQVAAVATKGWLTKNSELTTGLGLFETCIDLNCNQTVPSHFKEEWRALKAVELSGVAACALCSVLAFLHVGLVARTGSMYRWLNTALGILCWLTGGLILAGGVLLLATETIHFYKVSDPALTPGFSFGISVGAAILILLATVALHYEVVQENRRTQSIKYSSRRRRFRLGRNTSDA